MNKKQVNKLHERIFDIVIYITYFLIIISALDLSQSAPQYLQYLDYYIKIYICLFLMWRFNPLRKYYEFTRLDSKIAFSAGAFILTTTALNEYLIDFKDKIRTIIKINN
jgi:hypothetical protein